MANKCEITCKTLQFGHNVSHSNRKTNRTFDLNIRRVSFYSFLLGVKVRFNSTSAGIKTVDKYGGIDNFVLQRKENKLSLKAVKLRKVLMKHKDFVPTVSS